MVCNFQVRLGYKTQSACIHTENKAIRYVLFIWIPYPFIICFIIFLTDQMSLEIYNKPCIYIHIDLTKRLQSANSIVNTKNCINNKHIKWSFKYTAVTRINVPYTGFNYSL